jgi:hypothetical protein
VRGLVFDESAGHEGGDAITLNGGAGIVIEQVAIVNWGARGIALFGTDGAIVRDNRVHGVLGHALWVQDAAGTIVEGNDVADVQCETFAFDLCVDCGPDSCFACGDCLEVAVEDCVALASFEVGGQIGVRVLGTSTDTDIGHNWFHDFAGTGCGADGTNAAALFITRADARGGRIHHNLLEKIAPDGAANDVGHPILMFQGAARWTIDRNVVVNPGACGLCEGNHLFHGGIESSWEHNTVIGGRHGIDVRSGPNATFVGNLVTQSTDAPVRVQAEALAAAPSFDHNLYYDGDAAAVVGTWGDAAQLDLADWRDACDCDAASASADPRLAPGSQTPAGDGPAVDLGLDRGAPFHGSAPDAGALEAPRLVTATVPANAPATIVIELENAVAPPLAPGSCAALEIVVDEIRVNPIACTATADTQILVELAAPIVADQIVHVRTEASTVRDSSRIGNRIDAHLADADLTAVNEAPPGEPAPDTDSGETTPPSSGDAGCSCRTHGRGGSLWWPLLAWLIAVRRPQGGRIRPV